MRNKYEIRGDITAIIINSPTHGRMEAIISTCDLERVKQMQYTWYPALNKSKTDYYVYGYVYKENGKRSSVLLHRWILGVTCSKKQIDHINHKSLDNTRKNLNIVSHRENQQNRRKCKTNISGHVGVNWNKKDKRWAVMISVKGKRKYIGNFIDINEAVAARKKAELEFYEYKKRISNNQTDEMRRIGK